MASVVISSIIVGAMWFFRYYRKELQTPNITAEAFIAAWGVVYVGIAMLAFISPQLASAFAWLVLLSDILVNGKKTVSAVQKFYSAKENEPEGKGTKTK